MTTRFPTAFLLAVLVLFAGCAGVTPPTDTASPASTPVATDTVPAASTPTERTLQIHFINVGQSVSTLLIGPTGETMLIDTGHFNDDGEHVIEYLERQSIDRIDYLVTSHNDADHIGGNAAIINHYETEKEGIGAVYDPGIAASTQTFNEYLDAVEEHDVTLYSTREGDSIPFEGVDVQVMGPPEPYIESEARNENSIVLKFTHGQTSFLFTGDAEDDQEQYLVENYGSQLDATIMKAGHHGSSSSTNGQLLDAASPKAVIISSAYNSQFGHPTEEMLSRLTDRSIPAYWTATHGTIVLVSNGEEVSIRTQRDAPTDPASIRDAEAVEPGTTGGVSERVRISGESQSTATRTVATDGGTPTGSGELSVQTVHADAEGTERENLNDEYVVFENTGDAALDLSGWSVNDAAGNTYTFPDGYSLAAGATVTLHTGSGSDSESDLYWDAGSPVWNNDGDTVFVTNAEGDTVLEEEYT